ncbi:deoxyribose-phosphate aldolase [Miniphocaeibacter massiliensis]|uniref:deoxyribose-phosphate aldolase n=1 Tax=Miniphocaeibacter massiliensis TaxID=2041841 RepID=UPI000C1C1F0D|nr:deoxyribose-phosphate aldolase [Miniphocaeibacter massiliensis]
MELNKYIDHTNLKADATEEEIDRLCKEAIEYDFASVCVNGSYVKLAYEKLNNTNVEVCTVIGFPLGAMTTESKVFETKNAIQNGAREIDMVINIGKIKSRKYPYVKDEIREIVEASKDRALVKVIIETCLLTEEEKVKVCELAMEAGADFVKTSTGFSIGGATVDDVKLMKEIVGDKVKIKASGGIKTREDAIDMIKAGASRIGTSSGIGIITK